MTPRTAFVLALGVTSLLASCGAPQADRPVVPTACDLCADTIMSGISGLVERQLTTRAQIARIVDVEEDFAFAEAQLSENDYVDYLNADPDSTVSLLGTSLKQLFGVEASLPRWEARMSGPVCEVEIEEMDLELSITRHPRCLVIEFRHQGTTLFR